MPERSAWAASLRSLAVASSCGGATSMPPRGPGPEEPVAGGEVAACSVVAGDVGVVAVWAHPARRAASRQRARLRMGTRRARGRKAVRLWWGNSPTLAGGAAQTGEGDEGRQEARDIRDIRPS